MPVIGYRFNAYSIVLHCITIRPRDDRVISVPSEIHSRVADCGSNLKVWIQISEQCSCCGYGLVECKMANYFRWKKGKRDEDVFYSEKPRSRSLDPRSLELSGIRLVAQHYNHQQQQVSLTIHVWQLYTITINLPTTQFYINSSFST